MKIIEFFTSIQETYFRGDLLEVELLEEREVSTGGLPVGGISANELRVRLVNANRKFDIFNLQSPLGGLLRPNRRLRAWLGVNNEWVPLGTFWSIEWDTPDHAPEAIVSARDRLELLRKTTYRTGVLQQNVSLATLFTQVFQDAGLQPTEYAIDTALQQMAVPWAWIPVTSHREALRLLAEAALAVVYMDRDNVVQVRRVEDVPQSAVLTITRDEYFPPLQTPSRQHETANEIAVTMQEFVPVQTAEEVYRATMQLPAGTSQTIVLSYTKQPVLNPSAAFARAPSGVTISSARYFATGAEVTVQVAAQHGDAGGSLDGWTVQGVTVDTAFGNPAPSLKAVGGSYAAKDIGAGPNMTIEFDAYVIPKGSALCNFYFCCDANGAGQMFRLDSRTGGISGVAATQSWTQWSGPPGGPRPVSAGAWHHVKLVLGATTGEAFVDGTSFGTFTLANRGGYIGVHGDASGATGGY
ncbi:MAG: hypothetical protein C4346_19320, partial [Chloroflexota bacterium]